MEIIIKKINTKKVIKKRNEIVRLENKIIIFEIDFGVVHVLQLCKGFQNIPPKKIVCWFFLASFRLLRRISILSSILNIHSNVHGKKFKKINKRRKSEPNKRKKGFGKG
jgi:hypothetical protein